jgi:hypothetical protein
MMEKISNNNEEHFMRAFKGKFFGVLRWPQLEVLWRQINASADAGWYLYAVGEKPPAELTFGEEVSHFIKELDLLLRREHDEEYCGIVYANDIDNPSFIKVFDPNKIGTSCSIATQAPLPGWIISKLPPVDLADALKPTANRRRWWQKFIK